MSPSAVEVTRSAISTALGLSSRLTTLEVDLAGGGEFEATVLSCEEGRDSVLSLIAATKPDSAREWIRSYAEKAGSFSVMRASEPSEAAAFEAERLRVKIWRKLGGIWLFEHERVVSEQGATIAFLSRGAVNGRRLVATLKNGSWVEYRIDASNVSNITRFEQGILPVGMK
jgi:hypothetical protein